MDLKFLVNVNCESDITAYYCECHVDKHDFIEELINCADIEIDELSIDDILHKYAKWIPNPNYDGDPDILDESIKPKDGYFPITIYEC